MFVNPPLVKATNPKNGYAVARPGPKHWQERGSAASATNYSDGTTAARLRRTITDDGRSSMLSAERLNEIAKRVEEANDAYVTLVNQGGDSREYHLSVMSAQTRIFDATSIAFLELITELKADLPEN